MLWLFEIFKTIVLLAREEIIREIENRGNMAMTDQHPSNGLAKGHYEREIVIVKSRKKSITSVRNKIWRQKTR